MKKTKTTARSGFTLIELIIVIAILAIVSVVAIGKFADIRKVSALKANAANIKNIDRTIRTAIATKELREESVLDMFAYCESLIDCASGGGDATGAPGNYLWSDSWYDGQGGVVPGIYCGIKYTTAVQNAGGVGTGVIPELEEAHKSNVGLGSFANKLGIFYLREGVKVGKTTYNEITSLQQAGIRVVSRHNYANSQATATWNWATSVYQTQYNLHSTGGGPGQRPDLSAAYPVVLTNGSAIAVLNPAKCESIYRDLGLDFGSTNGVAGISAATPETYFEKGICKRVVVLGMGRDSDINTKYFENLPRNETLDKTYYRNYLLCFTMNNGTGNAGTTVKFAGVIDCQGNTWKGAQYNADWSSL